MHELTTEPRPSLTVLKSRPAHLAQMARPHMPLITRVLPQYAECANHNHHLLKVSLHLFPHLQG